MPEEVVKVSHFIDFLFKVWNWKLKRKPLLMLLKKVGSFCCNLCSTIIDGALYRILWILLSIWSLQRTDKQYLIHKNFVFGGFFL